ncbi:hypothetical protein [Paramagnetospirillum marisnigri]|nr:hypothetical protein [Paramagnetospirillum marisnigri]
MFAWKGLSLTMIQRWLAELEAKRGRTVPVKPLAPVKAPAADESAR